MSRIRWRRCLGRHPGGLESRLFRWFCRRGCVSRKVSLFMSPRRRKLCLFVCGMTFHCKCWRGRRAGV